MSELTIEQIEALEGDFSPRELSNDGFKQLCTLAKRGLATMPRPISEADRSRTIQALIDGNVWRQAEWDRDLGAWVDEWGHILNPTHFVVLEQP